MTDSSYIIAREKSRKQFEQDYKDAKELVKQFDNEAETNGALRDGTIAVRPRKDLSLQALDIAENMLDRAIETTCGRGYVPIYSIQPTEEHQRKILKVKLTQLENQVTDLKQQMKR